jgi:hypothetical protein
MMTKVSRYLLYSQLSLYMGLLVCLVLLPKYLLEHDEGGISNYGVHALTVVPYTLAFGLCGLFILKAAASMQPGARSSATLKRALYLLGTLFLFALVTTYFYKLNHIFDDLHILSGILLFVTEMTLGVWFALAISRNTGNSLLLAAQIIGFLLSFLTFIGALHILFIAQLLTSISFSSLLVRTSRVPPV